MRSILLLLFLSTFGFSQTQIGDNITGETDFYQIGQSISMSSDGNYLALGANITNTCARVFEKNNLNMWIQVGNDIPRQNNNFITHSVSLSSNGNILAISTGEFDQSRGCTRLFRKNSGNWIQIGNDIIGNINERVGYSVSLSADGTIVAIGGSGTYGTNDFIGKVRIFQNLSDNWVQIGNDIIGETIGDFFGNSISLSADGTIIAIGASYNADNGPYSGQVRVFKNLSGNWTQIGNNLNGENTGDLFGSCVSLSADGTTVAIGAPDAEPDTVPNNSNYGEVRIFKNISGTWTLIGNPIYGEASEDKNGYKVSLSADGNLVATGSYFALSHSGQVRVFKNASGYWSQLGSNINGENLETASFVSLSSNGTTLAIGAPLYSNNGTNFGEVKIYDFSSLLSSDEFILKNFKIYPNPTNEIISIELKENLQLEKINIYNLSGKLIKTEMNQNINVNNLAKGSYIFEVITEKGKAAKTVLIK